MSKKIMFICMTALLAAMMLVAGCGGGEKKAADNGKVLRIGSNASFAPFEFQEANGKEYVGFDMDLIRAVAKEMGYKAEIQNINFDGLIPALEAGNIDVAISGMTINDTRKQKVNFSTPYYTSGLTIIVKKDNTAIKEFKDLAGKKVAVQIGTTSAAEVKKIGGVVIKEFNTAPDAFMELKAGNVEAVVNDRPVNDYYIAKSGVKDVKALPQMLTSEEYGIAVKKKNADLLKKVNEGIEKVKKSGEYDKIFKKWFGEQKK